MTISRDDFTLQEFGMTDWSDFRLFIVGNGDRRWYPKIWPHKQICLNIQLTYSLLIFTWDKSGKGVNDKGTRSHVKTFSHYDWTLSNYFQIYVFWQRLFNFFLYNPNWISSSDLVIWFFRANPVSRRAVCLTLINHDWILIHLVS